MNDEQFCDVCREDRRVTRLYKGACWLHGRRVSALTAATDEMSLGKTYQMDIPFWGANPEDKDVHDAELRDIVNSDPSARAYLRSVASQHEVNPEAQDVKWLPPFTPVSPGITLNVPSEVSDIRPPTVTRSQYDFLEADGHMISIPGLRRVGEVTFTLKSLDKANACLDAFHAGKKQMFQINHNDGTRWTFEGYVTNVNDTKEADGTRFATVGVQVSGPCKLETESVPEHPNCQCVNSVSEERTTMAPKNAKTPKFYVGSKKAVAPNYKGETWAKFTEKEAIEHATKLVEQTGEEQFIVKIIKVVRRKPQPIVVETVK